MTIERLSLKTTINNFFIQKLGIDKAISFTLSAQIFTAIRNLIAIVLVTKFLTATEQGFYYTFTSILAIQIFFELGFSGIITQYAAHERANLTWKGNILEGGEIYQSRLNSLLHLTVKWFFVMSIILLVTLLIGGFSFFYYFSPEHENIDWQLPWILMATTTAFNLFVSPIIAFYEGLGKVENTAKLRFYSLFLTSTVFFTALCLDFKLYAFAFNSITGLIINIIWLFSPSIKETFLSIWHNKIRKHTINWRKEIFPYQWKIAVSWMSGFFLFQLFYFLLLVQK
jgi:O-antigen/teichoic acid export membrane protein